MNWSEVFFGWAVAKALNWIWAWLVARWRKARYRQRMLDGMIGASSIAVILLIIFVVHRYVLGSNAAPSTVAQSVTPRGGNAIAMGLTGLKFSASITVLKPGRFPPGDPRNVESVMFRTEGASDRLVRTGIAPPKTLRFIKPIEQTVRKEDLPATVRYKDGHLVVKRITDNGFTVDEAGARNIEVEAEIYR